MHSETPALCVPALAVACRRIGFYPLGSSMDYHVKATEGVGQFAITHSLYQLVPIRWGFTG